MFRLLILGICLIVCPAEPRAPVIPVSPCEEKDFGLERHHSLSFCHHITSCCVPRQEPAPFLEHGSYRTRACRRKGKRVSILGSETRMPVLVLHGLAHGAVDSVGVC